MTLNNEAQSCEAQSHKATQSPEVRESKPRIYGSPSSWRSVYISGPMRGYVNNNALEFYRAEDELEYLGYAVINPARMDREGQPVDWTDPVSRRLGILRDVEAVLACDSIALLHGWHLSRGASAEACVAEWAGKTVLYQLPNGLFQAEEPLHLLTRVNGGADPHWGTLFVVHTH